MTDLNLNMSFKDQKLKNLIKEVSAEFLQKNSNYTSLITVTDVALSERGKKATVFFTVIPTEKEKAALEFTKRMRADFREYFAGKSRMRALPFFDFKIDVGEKNRQVIDDISRKI